MPSVPGYHEGQDLHLFGHMAIRSLLSQIRLGPTMASSSCAPSPQLALQFSSLGSIDNKWLLEEFATSLASEAGQSLQGRPFKAQDVFLVWPTVEQVKGSIEGWAAGETLSFRLTLLMTGGCTFAYKCYSQMEYTYSQQLDGHAVPCILSGMSIPGSTKNVSKPFLQPLW